MIAQFQKYGYNKSGKNGTYAIGIKKKGSVAALPFLCWSSYFLLSSHLQI